MPQTTVYAGGHYECVVNISCTSYYTHGGQRIAMRQEIFSLYSGLELPEMSSSAAENPGGEWTWSATRAGISANNTVAWTSGAPNTPEGDQVAFLQLNGAMTKTVNITATGTLNYFVKLIATQRRSSVSNQTLQVVVDGVSRGTFTPGRNATYDTYSTTLFSLSPGTHTLTVRGTTTTGDGAVLVDAIVLQLDAGIVSYVHADQLGSASLTTDDANGTLVSAMRYLPFGETRFQAGNLPTDKRFTGQRQELGFGLYDYGARFYVPSLGRFVSADAIVPSAGDPQSFNRYAYVRNSPLSELTQPVMPIVLPETTPAG